jgi:hypothetical protein
MRSVAEYLRRATEFDERAKATGEPTLKRRCADVADCYRLLANERKRLIETGAIASDGEP